MDISDVLFWIIVIGILYWQICKLMKTAEYKDKLRIMDAENLRQWREAGYPDTKTWKKDIPAKIKPEAVVEKHQDIGPSVLTTKEFVIPKSSGYILPKIDNPAEWFVGNWGIGEPSPAEQKIIDELDKYHIDWYREVSFRRLILPSGGYSRFDFYLPRYKICIEYHGRMWHSSPDKQRTDLIKQEFCKASNLQLITWNSKHWHNIPETVEYLMRSLCVPMKGL